ncbi:MAG: radical SAM protein [Candidatus Muirbacterium halophilum]|nr:radical SAM protein [Candidatus Muirbacterium halophilum]
MVKALFYDKKDYVATTYTIFTTRGCPYNCSYCINNFWYGELYPNEQRVRRRSVDNVIAELKHAKKKFNIKSIMFEDDIFYLSPKWHWEFISKYKKQINLPFVCVMHPSHCQDYKVIKSLKDAGCIQVEIGIQTLNEKVRKKYLNRNETNKEITKALYNLHKAKVKYNIDHIAGLPDDNIEFHLDAVKLYAKYCPNRILLFFITNYPSTEIEKISLDKGKVSLKDIDNMRRGLGETDETTGSVSLKDANELERLRFLFGWLPYTGKNITNFLVNTGLYKILPVNRIFTKILPSIIATLTGGEPRGEVILKKYLTEIFNFKWFYKFK